MSKRNGFTLVEMLVCLGVIAVLASMAYALGAPAREMARQGACTSQLRSIYASLALYAEDNDYGSQYPELHGLTYVATRNVNIGVTLGPYGLTRQLVHCPSASIRMKERLGSSYAWAVLHPPLDETGEVSLARKYIIALEERLGSDLPVVECHIHDELYYAPSERDVDANLAFPFRILLRANGRVTRGRVFPPRTTIFTDLAFGTR